MVDDFIVSGKLQRVVASREHAERLLAQSRNHLSSCDLTASEDTEGAYALLYDAARKSLTAVLEVQGLRPTSVGGHVVIYQALKAQIDPPMGRVMATFNRLRRSRHNSEYPSVSEPELTEQDVREDLEKAKEIVEVAQKLLDKFPIF
ncbi:MAG: HEPN domain-containing protein [Candidatus Planktophila sp.]|nr:HEPN domain-containing protein [Candidatus Planktophila sp.]